MTIPSDGAPANRVLLEELKKSIFEQIAKWVVGAGVLVLGLAFTGWYFYFKQQLSEYTNPFPKDGIAMFQQGCPAPGWLDISKEDPNLKGSYIRLADGNIPLTGGNSRVVLNENNIPKLPLQATNGHNAADIALFATSGQHSEDKMGSFAKPDDGVGGAAINTMHSMYVGNSNPSSVNLEPIYLQLHFCKKT